VSWKRMHELLQEIFVQINAQNRVALPSELWEEYGTEIADLVGLSEIESSLIQFNDEIWSPKPVEAARLLRLLKQRWDADDAGRPLVGRIKGEIILRERPPYNVLISQLSASLKPIADIAAHPTYSSFQVEGWEKVLEAIEQRRGLVIVAPTGAGKTEVFQLPVIHKVARSIKEEDDKLERFVFLYPRVELLKDQLARIFKYVYHAERNNFTMQTNMFQAAAPVKQRIIIGFQFSGIAANRPATLNDPRIFDPRGYFRVVDQCPICFEKGENGKLKKHSVSHGVTTLKCTNRGCEFHISIAKNDHSTCQPHILVTTAESLDRLYLTPYPEFEDYLSSITGMVFDEVHVYDSLYGVHISNLIRSLEGLCGADLTKIASSATVSSPERFAAKLFYGDENRSVAVHNAANYDMQSDGLETVYFIQSPDQEGGPRLASTLIQAVMAMGHGLLKEGGQDEPARRGIIFNESVDRAMDFKTQIEDAEGPRGLWRFRTLLDAIEYQGQICPHANPALCPAIYHRGECWRGILGGNDCTSQIDVLRQRPLEVKVISSQNREDFWEGDILSATSTLEVGVDDDNIQATFHYRPPRTVFSFIQRRGRAGRRGGDIGYTFVVLGNDPADQFYFFRRHRLLDGSNYELPLNPQNPIIKEMHKILDVQRQEMGELIQRKGKRKGILLWVLGTLQQHPLVEQYYANEVIGISQQPYNKQERWLLEWISSESHRFASFLNLKWTLDDIENASPDELQKPIRQVRELIEEYLTGDRGKGSIIQQKLHEIGERLWQIIVPEHDSAAREKLLSLSKNLLEVWHHAQEQVQFDIDFRLAEAFHDFFRTLDRFNEPDKKRWILRYPPEVTKTVLQALFYLGLGTDEQWNCPVCVPYYIPDAYFQTVKPLIIEVKTGRTVIDRQLKQESITDLAYLFLPYRVSYRYHYPDFSTVETVHNPDWVKEEDGQLVVGLQLRGEGIQHENAFRPQKIYVRPLRGPEGGDKIFKLCRECYSLYDENRTRPCHGQPLRPVSLYARPVVDREGVPNVEAQHLSRTLAFHENITGRSLVLGSDVEGVVMRWTSEGYRHTREHLQFQARYKVPVSYSLLTKGISWNLDGIADDLLQDSDLKNAVEGFRKALDRNLILHTAAHLLYKAVTAISGVNEEVLEYAFSEEDNKVFVWERYEGGAGISEIIRDTLRSDPINVYRELLASVICPVNLAEQDRWSDEQELLEHLSNEWMLPIDDELLISVVEESHSEREAIHRQDADEGRQLCRARDGCPVCLYTTYCTAPWEERHLAVSHVVAEAIMQSLVRRVTRDELESMVTEHLEDDIVPPTQLSADPESGEFNVLLL
jgi:hypothetical protein